MKKTIYSFIILLFCCSISYSQIYRINEDFENYDSLTLPAGWSVWNEANFPIYPFTNWCVRDSGVNLPGLVAERHSVSHSGLKAIGVSWYTGIDTVTQNTTISDAWLVTKRVTGNGINDAFSFWVAGGTPTLLDSLQIWVSTVDSIPSHFNHYMTTFILGPGTWGQFTQNFILLDQFAGQDIWIGFRYFMDVTSDGVFVTLDDIQEFDPIGVQPLGNNIPKTYALRQNYPNPFNPTTIFEFDLPKAQYVNIVLYNTLGQRVKTLLNEYKAAGTYRVDFNAENLPSGTYFYRINAGDFVQTNKMVLIK